MKIWIAIIAAVITINVEAKTPKECEYIEEKIEKIDSRLRQKYKAATGERLKEQRREYKEDLRLCKKG